MDDSAFGFKSKAVVVGAGPVGCLAACMLARHHNYQVFLYDARPDPRFASGASRSRSINLAVSARGIGAIRAVDEAMAERILADVIPMKARMVHDRVGRQTSLLYGLAGECINSIDRNILNNSLITEAQNNPSISIEFMHKLVKSDFDEGWHVFETPEGSVTVRDVDFTVGADGAWSRVRSEMMRFVRMNYSQEYIDHAYLELSIPPSLGPGGEPVFALDPNHLHIWPRDSFMLIALANRDKSFTCTLFAPFSTFEGLPPPNTADEKRKVIKFFASNFPDAIALVGQDELLRCFREHPRGSLVTVKCAPYHYSDKAIIIGDAAHSMVPFYGQGMNCGLEDVHRLHNFLSDSAPLPSPSSVASPSPSPSPLAFAQSPIASVLSAYTTTRHPDLLAISKLAMENYVEMRSGVTRWGYLARKKIDGWLARMPGLRGRWIPLYTMVTFRADLGYAEAVSREHRQRVIVEAALSTTAIGALVATSLGLRWLYKWRMYR